MPYVSKVSPNSTINRLIENLINGDLFANTCFFIEKFDDEELEEHLCSEAFLYLEKNMNYGCQLTLAEKTCIIAALTLIALKCYNGDLYTHIEDKFRKYCSHRAFCYDGNDIQKSVRSVLDCYKKKVNYFNPNSYIAVPLVLCCVPHSRVGDLFTIAYDVYKKKLLFDEDVSDDQIKEKVAESLKALQKKELVSDSDKIKGTAYLMSSFTQSCIYSGCGVELLIQIITRCIRLILDYLSRPRDSFSVEAFYMDGYEQWTRKFESNSTEKESYEGKRTLSQPCFKLVGKSIHIVTGKCSMDESHNPTDVKICIYQGNIISQIVLLDGPNDIEYVDEDDPLSGYIINRKEIRIEGLPLDFLSYTIVCDGVEIYNSKARLNRKNLFFDGYGNEVKPGSDYIGYLSVVEHESNKSEYGDRIKENQCGDYFLATIEVNNHDVFRFDNEPYVFFKVSSPKLISHEIPWASFATREKTYSLYNDVIILFSAPCSKEDIYIVVDDNIIYRNVEKSETDARFNIRLFSKNHDENCAYTIKLFNLEAGYHNIRIFNSASKKQIVGANFDVVCDSELKKTYLSRNDKAILYELTGNSVDTQQLIFEYGTFSREIRTFIKKLGYGYLVIVPSSISYSIDEKKWNDINDLVPLCDIPESVKYINICAPANMKAFYIDKEGAVRKGELSLKKDDNCPTKYRLYLDYLRTLQDNKMITLSFEYGSCHKIIRTWYYPTVNIEECDFHFDENRKIHIFKFVYKGESELEARITFVPSNKVIVRESIHNGSVIELPDSAIENNVVGLKVSLHGVKYGALLNTFHDKPFMVFPKSKYRLKREGGKLLEKKIDYNTSTRILNCRFFFEGTNSSKIVINPSGFNVPIFEEIIKNNQEIEFNLSKFVFSSYNILLYAQNNLETLSFCEKSFFTSPPIKTGFSILHQRYTVTHFFLNNNKILKTNYKINFEKIELIGNTYYFMCSLFNNYHVINDIMVRVKDSTVIKGALLRLTLEINCRVNGKITNLKLKGDNQTIVMALIEK